MTSEAKAEAETAPQTRIDQCWDDAMSGPGDAPTDDQAGRFLDALLAEGLVCPAYPEDRSGGAAKAAAEGAERRSGWMLDESFEPITVTRSGVKTYCVFDTLERLADSSVKGAEFVAAPGREFFRMAAEAGAQLAFNPGVARSDILFSPEIVAMIAALSDAAEQDETIGADQEVGIFAPAAPPKALIAALAARLAAEKPLLREAWLIEVRQEGAEEASSGHASSEQASSDHASSEDAPAEGAGAPADPARPAREAPLGLTLALVAVHDGDASLAGLARDLTRLGSVLLPDSGLDVAILAEGERALEAARAVGLSFELGAA